MLKMVSLVIIMTDYGMDVCVLLLVLLAHMTYISYNQVKLFYFKSITWELISTQIKTIKV